MQGCPRSWSEGPADLSHPHAPRSPAGRLGVSANHEAHVHRPLRSEINHEQGDLTRTVTAWHSPTQTPFAPSAPQDSLRPELAPRGGTASSLSMRGACNSPALRPTPQPAAL